MAFHSNCGAIGAVLNSVVQMQEGTITRLFPGEYLVHPYLFMRGPQDARRYKEEQLSISPLAHFCPGGLSESSTAALSNLTCAEVLLSPRDFWPWVETP